MFKNEKLKNYNLFIKNKYKDFLNEDEDNNFRMIDSNFFKTMDYNKYLVINELYKHNESNVFYYYKYIYNENQLFYDEIIY